MPPDPRTPTSDVLVKVRDRELTLGKPDFYNAQQLVAYPAGAGDVLVAYGGRNEHGPNGSSTLWRISCTVPRADPFTSVPGADFGHSALSLDGRTLLFTGPDGILALDLTTGKTRRVTQAPTLAHCDTNDRPRALDVVGRFVDRNTLAFQRGGPCGYEAEWDATDMLLRNPLTAKASVKPAPRPPYPSVAIDASGGFWLADGLCEDRTTFNRILFSSDHGEHWQKIPVKTREDQPLRAVIADRRKPGSILVFSYACGTSAHADPGWVFVTEDAGRTFRPISVPSGVPSAPEGGPASEQDPLQSIAAPDGRIAHLVLYGASEEVGGGNLAHWESNDGGRSWKALGAAKAAPGPPPISAVLGEWTLTIRKDGLYRSRGEGPAVRIYPRP